MYGTHHQPDRMSQAEQLLAGAVCIWCEAAPKAETSHLCHGCRPQDVEGILRRPYQPHAVAAGS
jgi:hypothetical protein